MRRGERWGLVLLILLVAALLGARWLLYVRTQRAGLEGEPLGHARPADLGLRYEEFRIASGDRRLDAWWVPADSTAPESAAVLLYHGNGEAISDWVSALRLLHDHHVACMIFDYTGYGASGGEATVDRLTEDGRAALAEFDRRAAHARRRCLVGLSLGTAVAMSAAAHAEPPPDGVVLLEPFASGREAAVFLRLLPRWVAPLMPDAFDNVARARELRAPLLIVHSRADERFPVSQSEKILAAARGPKRLVVLERFSHAAAYREPGEGYWRSVVEFATEATPGR